MAGMGNARVKTLFVCPYTEIPDKYFSSAAADFRNKYSASNPQSYLSVSKECQDTQKTEEKESTIVAVPAEIIVKPSDKRSEGKKAAGAGAQHLNNLHAKLPHGSICKPRQHSKPEIPSRTEGVIVAPEADYTTKSVAETLDRIKREYYAAHPQKLKNGKVPVRGAAGISEFLSDWLMRQPDLPVHHLNLLRLDARLRHRAAKAQVA